MLLARFWRRSLATRLTLVATGATALVVVLLLAGLYAVVTRQLQAALDDGLRARSADLQSSLDDDGADALAAEPYAQLYAAGQLRSSRALRGAPPLAPDLEQVQPRHPVLLDRDVLLPGRTEPLPLRVLGRRLPTGEVLVVAASRRPQQEAAERLAVGLAVLGPLLLLAVAGVVSRAVRAALRPVDALSRRAAQISEARDTDERLPAVEGDDEIARLARTLDAMLGRLARAFQRERAFVDDASHELRTPVTVLRGEIELALSDLDDRSGVEQSLRAALEEAERLSRLAEDLLVLARERSGGLALRADDVDVPELLGHTARRLAPATGLELAVVSPALRVEADRDRLEQVLDNLVRNAAEAGAHRVVLRAFAAADEQLVLGVEDDGPGFPAGFLEEAFGRFRRADAARTRGSGAGLGLSLVAAIVSAAGGIVTAGNDSPLGGAAVRVRLPLRSTGRALSPSAHERAGS